MSAVRVERGVPLRVIRRRVRVTRTRQVEQNHPVIRLERRRHVTPHRLPAPEPVQEHHHRAIGLARQHGIQPGRHSHARIVGGPGGGLNGTTT